MLLHVIPAQICYILFLPKIHGEFQGLEGSEGRGASRASGRTRGLILDTSFFVNLSIAFGMPANPFGTTSTLFGYANDTKSRAHQTQVRGIHLDSALFQKCS